MGKDPLNMPSLFIQGPKASAIRAEITVLSGGRSGRVLTLLLGIKVY